MTETCDFLIIGAGIAGASAAFELSKSGRVVVLERESAPGYHTTGRSAALFTETYGNRTIRAVTKASRAFMMNPPDGLTDHPILTARGAMLIGRADQDAAVATAVAEGQRVTASVRRIDGAEARHLCPALRADYVASAVYEPDAVDIDVNALHRGYLKLAKSRNTRILIDAEVTAIARNGRDWQVESRAGTFTAPVVINAAGAWCDVIGRMAGLKPIGLVPKRRTAFTFDAPPGLTLTHMPMVSCVEESFYFKPDAGRFMGSLADETPSEPCDAQPEELDLAMAVERIETATTLQIRRFASKWAGLRSFVADKTLVNGLAADATGFLWLAGQGGYGIQTSPAMGRIAAAVARGEAFPADVAAFGVGAADLSPARPGITAKAA
ncbi:MAG: FAD-binding oxidoreductase [Alphaproteobacteria bacterium]|nr:FAD-binding oxidoreductase [Alphaproteobacteria bacterium]